MEGGVCHVVVYHTPLFYNIEQLCSRAGSHPPREHNWISTLNQHDACLYPMPANNQIWSMNNVELQIPDLAKILQLADDEKCSSVSSRVSEQRSFSSSSGSSDSSTDSILSDLPLVRKHGTIKVPLHVAATLAHRGFSVDEIGMVTWRANSPLHPRNWSMSRKTYDVSSLHLVSSPSR